MKTMFRLALLLNVMMVVPAFGQCFVFPQIEFNLIDGQGTWGCDGVLIQIRSLPDMNGNAYLDYEWSFDGGEVEIERETEVDAGPGHIDLFLNWRYFTGPFTLTVRATDACGQTTTRSIDFSDGPGCETFIWPPAYWVQF